MRQTFALIAVLSVTVVLPAVAHAGTVTVANGVFSYTETDANAGNVVVVSVSSDGSRLNVSDRGRSGGKALTVKSDGSCTVNRATGSCPAAGVTSIVVATGDQNDTISQVTTIASHLDGGNGNDKITGGPGNDVLVGGVGADTLNGGAGTDTADYSARTAPVTLSLDSSANDGEPGEADNVNADVEVLAGGAGDDTLTGNDGANTLLGNAGNDTLDGRGGDDTLTGGDGTDTASYANAASGVRVVLDGKPGDGVPNGESDNADTENVIGSPGDDVLIGSGGPNSLAGGDGSDRILGGKGADTLDGGAGDDILQSLDGAQDAVACGDGQDGVVSDKADVRSDCEYIKYRSVAATTTALHTSKGVVRVPVRCSPATVAGCRGLITLQAGRRSLGSLHYSLRSGRRWVARVKLTPRGRAYVARHRLATAALVVHDVDGSGVRVRTTQTL